tara:strand:- start:2774 stop:2983 length:210 start_codon:yes stop_codon:yes gene_type:complete
LSRGLQVGDLVRVKNVKIPEREGKEHAGSHGIIIDFLEDNLGFYDFEILLDHGPEWFRDLELELIDEAR